MLGRGAGLTAEEMAHLGDESPPEGLYEGAEAVAQRYTVRSTRAEPIEDELYAQLEAHFTQRQIMDLCFTVGLANLVNRFHATFHTDVDESTLGAL